MIAHTTYRSKPERHEHLGRTPQEDANTLLPDGQYAVESYLAHHAEKLARRFDTNAYLRIVHAINTHHVGRGRDGITAALANFTGSTPCRTPKNSPTPSPAATEWTCCIPTWATTASWWNQRHSMSW